MKMSARDMPSRKAWLGEEQVGATILRKFFSSCYQ